MANIIGTIGNEFLTGTLENDSILGFAGNDTLLGLPGNDTINGNEGNDSLRGDEGDDYVRGGQNDDEMFGNLGIDTLFGDLGNDTISGNEENDLINGNEGNDVINGNQGNDTVRGGEDDDVVRGGQDNDEVFGDRGNDTGFGDFGNDSVYGGEGLDVLNGNEGNDTLNGNEDNDIVRGGKDDDLVRGGQNEDEVYGDLGNDTLFGDQGNDSVYGGQGIDLLFGNADNDVLNGNEGNDTLFGGQGLDLVRGGQDNDQMFGELGNDTLYGDLGNDSILGNENDDLINGNQGDDTLNGNEGNDTVRGGQGNDYVRGGQNEDAVFGDLGNDTLYGDLGNDTVYAGEGTDLLFGNEGNDTLNGNQGDDTIFGGQGNDYARGGMDNDRLFGDEDNDTLYGDLGNDTVFGGIGNDLMNGNEGDDILNGNEGLDTVRGGQGNDLVRGGQNDDQLYGDKGDDTVFGDLDNDTVFGGEGADLLFGNEGDDVLNGNEGNDSVFGGQGKDLVRGGQGNDSLFGDRGSDTLFGDLGADTLTGDSQGEVNTDIFVFGKGMGGPTRADADIVTDWQHCIDLISLTGGLSYADINIQQGTGADAANTIVTDKATGEFLGVLLNVDSNSIDGSAFIPSGPSKVSIVATNPTTIESTPTTAPGLFTLSIPCDIDTDLTINYTITGTAANGKDYQIITSSVILPAGSETVTIPVIAIDDTEVEQPETVTLTLNPGTGYEVATSGKNTATVTILDNDALTQTTVSLFASDPLASEIGPDPGQFTFARTGDVSQPLTVNYSLSPLSSATNNVDYTANPALNTTSITIPAGSDRVTVNINPILDSLIEGNETVILNLGAGPGYTVGPANNATVVIQDNPVVTRPIVGVTAPDPISEENGSKIGTFQFSRTGGDISQPLTIKYTITGTATPGTDYSALSGTVTINAGQTVSSLINVTPSSDAINEPTETVVVTVTEDSPYLVGSQSTATVSILDNNPLANAPAGTLPVRRYNSSGATLLSSHNNFTDAVAAASDNDIIVAIAGTYSEPGTVTINRPLTVRGPNAGLSPSSGGGVNPAIVSAPSGQRVFAINPGISGVTIEGLTIQADANAQNAVEYTSNIGTPSVVIRQNQFTGNGPNNGGIIRVDFQGAAGSKATIVDNLIRDVNTTSGVITSGIQAFRIDQVNISDNVVAKLTGPGIVADSVTNPNNIINSNTVSDIGQQGIQLAGGSATIANNNVTNVNLAQGVDDGGIRLRNSGFGGNLITANVFGNTITNSVNGIAIRTGDAISGSVTINNNNLIGNTKAGLYHGGTGTINATNNWWDDPSGPIVGGTGRNAINGPGAGSVTFNPFANQPF